MPFIKYYKRGRYNRLTVWSILPVLFVNVLCYGIEITFNTLVDEMVNIDKLADYPNPGFISRQFSSYDRRSHNKSDFSEEGWFGNADAGQIIRTEIHNGKEEFVLMDAEGPGAIVRIWSANADDAGLIRVYLDNSTVPEIEMPLSDMLNGEDKFFIKPISGIRAKGWNCYMPIPYLKHCKVTIEYNRIYYHINYRTYSTGTDVTTFLLKQAKENLDKVKRTADILTNCETLDTCGDSKRNRQFNFTLKPDQSKIIKLIGFDRAICGFICKLIAEDTEQALRKCLLEIYFDEAKSPNIQSPLGDFFGSAPGINPFKSVPLEVCEDGTMKCRWIMPFKNKAIIKFTNFSSGKLQINGQVKIKSRLWEKNTMHFNARWKISLGISVRPRRDWNYIECKGKGRYVGNMLSICNPVSSWWGEGDEKIYIDGEDFPSTFGTGTEDYYGYAWSINEIFTHAYHNQTRCDGPKNMGHTSLSRFHILDSMPFNSSFKFDMELWHHAAGFTVDLSQISYWYERPETEDNFNNLRKEDLVVPALPMSVKAQNVYEAEDMRIVDSNGMAFNQNNFVWFYSGDKALWWSADKPGDKLELGFKVEKAGRYNIKGKFTEGFSLGIHSIFVNNKPAGVRDWYSQDFKIKDSEETLGVFNLKQGENILKVICKSKNPKSFGNIFTVDYIRLIPIDCNPS